MANAMNTGPQPEIRNEPTELRLLFEVSQLLDEGPQTYEQLRKILELVAKYTGMMQGALVLAASTGGFIEAFLGTEAKSVFPGKVTAESTLAGQTLVRAVPLFAMVGPAAAMPLISHRVDVQKEEVAFISIPVVTQGKPVGVLAVDRLYADSVALAEDVRLLQVIASIIARAMRVRHEFHELHSAVVEENRRLHTLLNENFDAGSLIGSSGSMRAVIEEVQQVTASNATVLVRGESGTGKELVASLIHSNSPRSGKPFIKVNCAALPEGLVESELFGHERGAFTGAFGARRGRFEMAHGGTLFLDEVGDMSPLTQSKLLRALQQKEFERVGGTETLRVDVRVIAATNRNLEEMVTAGSFRQDLYYRLSVFPVVMPPLRERKDDIMPLVTHFVDVFSKENNRTILRIAHQVTAMLMEYSWPGNIRELENVIQRAVVLCGANGVIDATHLPAGIQSAASLESPQTLDEALGSVERRYIVQSLEDAHGNMVKAAQQLGITVRMMGLRMRKYHLDYRDFRS